MAIIASPTDGLGVNDALIPPQPGVLSGFKFMVLGQTANTSGSNAANQQAGTVSIPSGTTDGATVTITNSLITTTSLIFLQVKGSPGKKVTLDTVVPGTGSATFKVNTTDAAATSASADCWYFIVN